MFWVLLRGWRRGFWRGRGGRGWVWRMGWVFGVEMAMEVGC